jgi:hypothetical protein
MRCTEIHAHKTPAYEVHTHELHAREVHVCEMHVYEVLTPMEIAWNGVV